MKWLFSNERHHYEAPLVERNGKSRLLPAGREYEKLNQLTAAVKEEPYLYEDIYGREWAYVSERYPCFDSYDYLNEDRYYHWYVCREGDSMWVVYRDDGGHGVTVMQDPERIDYTCRKILETLGWIELK